VITEFFVGKLCYACRFSYSTSIAVLEGYEGSKKCSYKKVPKRRRRLTCVLCVHMIQKQAEEKIDLCV
jgi:hypothetical protein